MKYLKYLKVKFLFLKYYLLNKTPRKMITYAENGFSKSERKKLVKNILNGNKIDRFRSHIIDKCEEYNFNLESVVYFKVILPFQFSIKENVDFSNFCGFRENHLFSVFFNTNRGIGHRISRYSYGEIIFNEKITEVDVFVLVRDLPPEKISEELASAAEQYGYTALNKFIMAYMAVSDDYHPDLINPESSFTLAQLDIYDKNLKKIIQQYYVLGKELRNESIAIPLNQLEVLNKIAIEEKPEESISFSIYYKLIALKHRDLGRYRESVMEIQIFVETFLTKLYFYVEKSNGITLEKLSDEMFGSILNNRIAKKLGINGFSKRSNLSPENKVLFQYYHYCYELRNKVVHANYFPHKIECDLAIDVALNLTGYVSHQFSKIPNVDFPFELEEGLVLRDVDEVISNLKDMFPSLY